MKCVVMRTVLELLITQCWLWDESLLVEDVLFFSHTFLTITAHKLSSDPARFIPDSACTAHMTSSRWSAPIGPRDL